MKTINPLFGLWPDLHLSFNTLASALNVLAAMITPALLIFCRRPAGWAVWSTGFA
jgi:hypothetical protein